MLLHNMRRASKLRYSLLAFPALVPELLLAAVKAFAYGCVGCVESKQSIAHMALCPLVISPLQHPDSRLNLVHADQFNELAIWRADMMLVDCLVCRTFLCCLPCSAACLSYPVMTGSVLGLFSCKQLDSLSQVPGEVNAAQGNFWNRVSQCSSSS